MEDIRPYLRTMRRSVGQIIHTERRRQNMPLWKIEQQTGLSPYCVDRIELGKGELKMDHLLRLARFLNLEVNVTFKDLLHK